MLIQVRLQEILGGRCEFRRGLSVFSEPGPEVLQSPTRGVVQRLGELGSLGALEAM